MRLRVPLLVCLAAAIPARSRSGEIAPIRLQRPALGSPGAPPLLRGLFPLTAPLAPSAAPLPAALPAAAITGELLVSRHLPVLFRPLEPSLLPPGEARSQPAAERRPRKARPARLLRERLSELAGELERPQEKGGAELWSASARRFDGAPAGAAPAVEAGARIVRYQSPGGGFATLDAAGDMGWVERFPELEDHERRLIRRLANLNPLVELVLPENWSRRGQRLGTPDLLLGGIPAELKRWDGRIPIRRLLDSAHRQISDFSRRHGLPGGVLILEIPRRKSGFDPLIAINDWASQAEVTEPLRGIWVFFNDGIEAYARGPDGAWRAADFPR